MVQKPWLFQRERPASKSKPTHWMAAGVLVVGLSWWLVGAAPHAVQGTQGTVAADHPLASQAGLALLRQGGNAVDAACAALFAVGVVNPTGSGIGGGGFMVLKHPKHKQAIIIDFREVAPAAARADMFTKRKGKPNASRTGGLAVGVPGEVRGCAHAVKKYGKRTLKQVMAPAIRLAKDGFPVGIHLANSLKHYKKRFHKHKELMRIFYPGGKALRYGQRLRRPKLAAALAAIATQGPKVFYEGWIAKDIVAAVRKAGGIITLQDLKTYQIKQRKPLVTTYRGYQIHTMPPPSSGGIAIIQALQILRHKNLQKMGHNSSGYLHLLAESLKHAFADRARFLGDPDFVKVPVAKLTSQKYADALYKRIKQKTGATSSYGMQQAATRASPRDGGTTHLSTLDKNGFAVAVTSTINTSFGAKVVASRSGIILNNEMDDFTTNPGKPNAFGLIQSRFNTIYPGKRPLSSMSPTLVTKQGKALLALGGSGGPTIITGTLQVLLNVLDFKMELNDALSRSRIHHQWLPPLLFIEQDLPKDVRIGLQRRGHKTRVWRKPFTAVQAAQRKGGFYFGASDPRKGGAPATY